MTKIATKGLWSREFVVLSCASSVFFLGIGALNALLPRYVVDELSGTEATAGFVMGVLALTALVSRPWFGRTADRRGARSILLLGAAVSALSVAVLALWPTITGAVVSRLIAGAGAAAFVTGSTLLAIDLAPDDRRSQAASYMLISFHLGMGIGPLGGEWLLRRVSYTAVWWMVVVVSLLAAAILLRLQPRPGDPAAPAAPWVHRAALLPGVLTLLGVFAFNGFMMFVPLYAREVGLRDAALVFTTSSVTIILVRVFFSRIPDRIGPIRAGSFSLALTCVAALVVAFWATPFGLFLGAALLAGGLSMQSPSFVALAVEGVPSHERGSATATYTAFFDIANALVGPSMGLLIAQIGYGAAFSVAAFMALIGLLVLHLLVAPRRERRLLTGE